MGQTRFTRYFAVATALLSFAHPASALSLPVSSFDVSVGVSPTLVRGHHGRPGGWHHGHRPGGGYHGRPGYGYHHRPGGYHGWHGHHYHGWHGGYYGGWRRPYRWAPGGAIAAGAAIGFMSAATAAAIASSAAPAPGLCWYYTDASRRAGFWDNCPQ